MRVAIVSPYSFDHFGGVQDQAAQLGSWLREAGHDAWVVAPGSGGPDGTIHVGAAVSVPANRSRAPITLDPRAVGRVRAAVAGADVVHVHEPFMPITSLAALIGSKVPIVGTFHADPGGLARAVYRGASWPLRRLAGRLAVATAVSPVAAASVERLVDLRLIPNGVDVDAYRDDLPKANRALFIGRDERRKGLQQLLLAWPLIRARVPEAELRVVGAERTSGPAGVTFLGRVDEESKRTELAEASVMCAPNTGGESFGIVLVEAMASGCAVVASDIPAFRGGHRWRGPAAAGGRRQRSGRCDRRPTGRSRVGSSDGRGGSDRSKAVRSRRGAGELPRCIPRCKGDRRTPREVTSAHARSEPDPAVQSAFRDKECRTMEQGTDRVKRGLAEMLKGGVIMDVVDVDQARIAEEAGAVSVMALERVPADIRRDGGVARMSDPSMIAAIIEAVSVPVMAKVRIGHFVEAQVLQSLGVDYVDESEVLTPADEEHHIDKWAFTVPFVCGARDLGEALRRIGEGSAMIRTKGEAGTGNVVEAVRHMRSLTNEIKRLASMSDDQLMSAARDLRAPYGLVREVAETGRLPMVNFAAGGIATPADAALMMQLGCDGVFVGSGIFKSDDPEVRARAIVEAVTYFEDPQIVAKVSRGLGAAMPGLETATMPESERLANRGW